MSLSALPYSAKISGTGMYVPPRRVTNYDLEKIMDTSHDWIVQRSGIVARHHVDAGVGASDLAAMAAEEAIAKSKIAKEDIDLILFASLSPDYYFPGSAVLLQHKLKLKPVAAMDVRCQCTGFIYAMETARIFCQSGLYRHVLVVGSEVHSPILDLSTTGREVSVLFGDGAGAVIVSQAEKGNSDVLAAKLYGEGQYASKLWVEKPGAIGGQDHVIAEDIALRKTRPQMEGRYVFKHAVTRMQEVLKEALEISKLQVSDVDVFLFHQANVRINDAVCEALQIPRDKAPSNIDKYGNCSAASIPILLHESVESGLIKRGQTVALTAFGAGFTWGSMILRF